MRGASTAARAQGDMEVAEQILTASDLGMPPQAAEVLSALTIDGSQAFSQQIVQALIKAQMKNDLRPVRDVVEAWYRTLLFVNDEGHDRAVAAAEKMTGKKAKPLADLVAELDERISST